MTLEIQSSPWNKKRPKILDANPRDPTMTTSFGLEISKVEH